MSQFVPAAERGFADGAVQDAEDTSDDGALDLVRLGPAEDDSGFVEEGDDDEGQLEKHRIRLAILVYHYQVRHGVERPMSTVKGMNGVEMTTVP